MTRRPDPIVEMKASYGFPSQSLSLVSNPSAEITIARWRTTIEEVDDASMPSSVFVRLRTPTGSWRHVGGRIESAANAVGQVGLVSAGSYGAWTFDHEQPHEVMHMYMPDGFLTSLAEAMELPGTIQFDDALFVNDRVLTALGTELDAALDRQGEMRLFMDGLCNAIASRLVTTHSNYGARVIATSRADTKLATDWRIRRTIEQIEAALERDMGLAELAAGVGLSPSRYTALFRAATGLPPHRWLLRRRIERARQLLADPRLSITDIAFALGFSSSQHFATVFRRMTGATPSSYRQERLG